METVSGFFKSTIPGYFQSLPLPSTIGGFTKLSARDWLQLTPLFASVGLVGYIGYKEVNDYLHRREHAWVNKDYCKNKPKIADIISRSEVNAALDKNEKVAYCRCWKSATFPFCDGAHGAHNRATGDNTGPLVFKN